MINEQKIILVLYLSIILISLNNTNKENFGTCDSIGNSVSNEMSKVSNTITKPFKDAYGKITNAFNSVFNEIGNEINKILAEMGPYLAGLGIFAGIIVISPFILGILLFAGLLSLLGVKLWMGVLIGTVVIGGIGYYIYSQIMAVKDKIFGSINNLFAKLNLGTIMGKFTGKFGEIFSKFNPLGDIGGAFSKMISGVMGPVCGIIDGIKKGINGAIDIVNKIPGVNVKRL